MPDITRCGCEEGRKCILVSFCQVQDLMDTIAEQREEIERLQGVIADAVKAGKEIIDGSIQDG